jgi:membrane protease subunit (stomatin/prohibitin family)
MAQPVDNRVRAFGTYAFQVSDPAALLRQLAATDPSFETYEIANQLRNAIVARFVDAIGQAHLAVLDLAGNCDRLGQPALEKIRPDLALMGLALRAFYIENISLPRRPPRVDPRLPDARRHLAACPRTHPQRGLRICS